ncbi:MAG: hypothetical protein LUG93_08580 [Lachnospiraceae bacterium]|nr:hypothetical protein [Lachnospiraceae bacterium]
MHFYSLTGSVRDEKALAADYRPAREIGVIRLGEEVLYFRKQRKIFYVPYDEIRQCFRQVMLVPARLCCGQGNLSVENFVICTDAGELAQIQIPGERAGKALLEEIRVRAPKAEIGYWKNKDAEE